MSTSYSRSFSSSNTTSNSISGTSSHFTSGAWDSSDWNNSSWKLSDGKDSHIADGSSNQLLLDNKETAMSKTTGAYYIVAVSGGACIEKTQTEVVNKFRNNSTAQRWTIEYGDSPDTVAFRNVSNGEYLCFSSGTIQTHANTSTTKQWWTLEKEETTDSWW